MANFFPRWTNWIPLKVIVCVIVIACALSGATWYYATPKYTKIGYQPIQPVPFPHDIHVEPTGNGLPVLSQFRGSGRAIERAQHCDMHELPHASGER